MRIALIAPPWYSIPPSGYGGIEWVVALLADGLSDRDAIGDRWYEASHVVSVYEHGEDFLFFLGRADEEKAPHLAIEAARLAGRRLVLCVTTKNQREQAYWAEMVEPLLGDDVQVRGECDQEQKTALLAGAAGLLFPVQWPEPFGLVMTEAMACGTPVVAWGNGSVPEVVADGQTGFIVSSVQEMAAAVDRLGELDPHAMRARVEQRFSAEAMVAGYEQVYDRAVGAERAAAS